MKVPGRVEMGAVMGRQLHLLDGPALAIRQILRFQSLEELQHARQALLMVDILDRRMPARRIGWHVVLQRHRDVDQFARHGVFPVFLYGSLLRYSYASRKPARSRNARSVVRNRINMSACPGLAALVVTPAVYVVESSQPGGSAPESVTPEVLMISVTCVQPIGRFASEAAKCFIAVAPLGWILRRPATSSAMPSCARIFAT